MRSLALSWVISAALAAQAAAWELDLLADARVGADRVLVGDVAAGPVPPPVAGLVLVAGGTPGNQVEVSRQLLLRKLVESRLAAGVKIRGAQACVVTFAGEAIAWDHLEAEIRRGLEPLVPGPAQGAPDPWLELAVPAPKIASRGDWRLVVDRTEKLEPGRNLVGVAVVSAAGRENLTVQVTLHVFGAVARARGELPKGSVLDREQFTWEFVDLAGQNNGLVIGAEALVGQSLKRTLAGGDLLRLSDLQATPVILAGDPVELKVTRGQVCVTVRAYARQAGVLGQTIPVRNDLTGRLVNARVAGPGLVEWRR